MSSAKTQFIGLTLSMSWQLAVAVFAPILLGVWIGKAVGAEQVVVIAAVVVAFALSALVMWNAMQQANKIPVPKLSAAQKAKIKKQYEEDDE